MQAAVFKNSDENWRSELRNFLSNLLCLWSWGLTHINMNIIRYLEIAKRAHLLQKPTKNKKGFYNPVLDFKLDSSLSEVC